MKMHEVVGSAHRQNNKYQHALSLTLDHHQADQFRHLTRGSDDVRVLKIEDVGDEKAVVTVACTSTVVRDQLADAW